MTSTTEEHSGVDQFNHSKAEISDKKAITSRDNNSCRQDISFPKYYHALWVMATTIMLILIVGLITTTVIGFTIRVTTQESDVQSSLKTNVTMSTIKNSLDQTSRTENDIFEITRTEDMTHDTQINIDIILARNNYSHLLTILSNKNLSIDLYARTIRKCHPIIT